MGTRCSGRLTRSRLVGTATAGNAFTVRTEGAVLEATEEALDAFDSNAPITSPFVTRPSLPVPATALADILFSASIFAAAGIAIEDAAELEAATGADATAGLAAGADAAAGAAVGAVVAVAVASVSIRAINSPATTLLPSPLTISINTPCAGAGSSNTTLSVSISIRFSSRAMASPTFLCHCNKVASATDSDN